MEVEVKVRLNDLEGMKQRLIDKGASFSEPVSHNDMYFKPEGFEKRVQGPGDFILRIRRCGERSVLTFKALTEILGAWVEHETDITDPGAMEKIILSSGFVNCFNLNKRRFIGKLGEFEICIDDVKELGKFMEVCLISDQKEEPRERIFEFLKNLGFSQSDLEPRGYGELIGEKMGHKFGGMR